MTAYARSVTPSYHEEQAHHNPPEDAPPPYEEVTADAPPPVDHEQQTSYTDHKPARGGSLAESLAPINQASTSAPPPTSTINRQFPVSFNIYLSSNVLYQKRFALGEHKDEPLYAISVHTGLSGNPDLILRTETSSSSAPLATVLFKTFSSDMILTIPSLATSQPPTQIRMVADSWPTRSWSFAVEVTRPDGSLQREPFEWRHSSGDEVQRLSGWGTGWKLVHTGPGGLGTGSGPRSGEGNEVVAVFAVPAMSITKAVEFRFVGSGMTGEFGERWAVTAVISGLGIWEKEKRRKARAARS